MTPSRFQAAPIPPVLSQMFCTAPLGTAIFFSLPCEEKPRKRLSGDQNGDSVRSDSDPGTCCQSSASRRRIHNEYLSRFAAVITRYRPSGDRLILSMIVFAGAAIEN